MTRMGSNAHKAKGVHDVYAASETPGVLIWKCRQAVSEAEVEDVSG